MQLMGFKSRCAWDGGRTKTARDYVQDGLVAMWDGVENAGWGTHIEEEKARGTIWTSLVGGYAFPVTGSTLQEMVSLTDNHFEKPLGYTQFLGDITPAFSTADTTVQLISSSTSGYDREYVIRTPSVAVYCNYSAIYVYAKIDGVWRRRSITKTISPTFSIPKIGDGSVHLATVILNGINLSILDENTVKAQYDMSAGEEVSLTDAIALYNNNYTGESVYRYAIYNRALTSAEIAANYAIDKARFGIGGAV